jgi:hypothetical protein
MFGMNASINKHIRVLIPTPFIGKKYAVSLLAVQDNMCQATIDVDGIKFTTLLPATASKDWMETMRNKFVRVMFKPSMVQTEITVQDRVAYVGGERVYINPRNINGLPLVITEK